MEALAEYELKRSDSPPANAIVEFRVAGKNEIEILELKNRKERVETDLKVSWRATLKYTDKYLSSVLL